MPQEADSAWGAVHFYGGCLRITAACSRARTTIFSFFTLFLLSAVIFGTSVLMAPAAAQSNVVVIMTDDQRLDDLQVMTKTKRLIEDQGTTFSNFYVTFPLCCPSRATFITGQYPHNHSVVGNRPPRGGYTKLDNTNTLPVWLQEAGYFTSHIGRYLNGYGQDTAPTLVPPGWTDWQGRVAPGGYYNHTINDNGELVTYGESEEDYQTDVVADRAVETITEAAQRQPFFLSIATIAPHVPAMPAPRHEGVFDNEPLPHPPSFNEEDVSDKPSFIRNRSLISPEQEQELTASHRGRLGSLLAVDDLVERVVDTLADTGVLDNTVLIFTSDNGWFLGEHRLTMGKVLAYEEAARVPLLIRGGGLPKGATVDQVVGNIDLAPTIIDLADAAPGRVMDGRSLLPLGSDPNFGNARDLLIETLRYQAVRNDSFLYVEHDTGEQELYDMRESSPNYDPYQLESRHADSAYSQIMAELANKLNELRTCSGDSCNVQ